MWMARVVDSTGYIQLPEYSKDRVKPRKILPAASIFPYSAAEENCRTRNMKIEINKLFNTF